MHLLYYQRRRHIQMEHNGMGSSLIYIFLTLTAVGAYFVLRIFTKLDSERIWDFAEKIVVYGFLLFLLLFIIAYELL